MRGWGWPLAGLLAGAAFFALVARTDSEGSTYPPYSTYRADPRGARVLFEALEGLAGLEVERCLQPPKVEPQAVTFALGLSTRDLPPEEAWILRARQGERLVLALDGGSFSARALEEPEGEPEAPPEPGGEEPLEADDPREAEVPEPEPDPGLRFGLAPRWQSVAGEARAIPTGSAPPGWRPLIWSSPYWLDLDSPDWVTLMAVEGRPVLVEKRFGSGSIVVAADGGPWSNGAQARSRRTELLTWSLGDRDHVRFDETALGVRSKGSVARLARHYRLGGAAFGLALVFGLIVWRAVDPFEPGPTADQAATAPTDEVAALSTWIGRGVADDALVGECRRVWERRFEPLPTASEASGPVASWNAWWRQIHRAGKPTKRVPGALTRLQRGADRE